MLIDDDALIRETLGEMLAEEGIEVDGLANAEDALILLGSGQAPDVLVADIDLGAGLSGLDPSALADAIRAAAVEAGRRQRLPSFCADTNPLAGL
jgi:CheY-like chemotaxis protein